MENLLLRAEDHNVGKLVAVEGGGHHVVEHGLSEGSPLPHVENCRKGWLRLVKAPQDDSRECL